MPLPAIVLFALLVVGIVWLVRYIRRMPKKPEHEREPERFRDPAITAYKGGPGGSSF